MQCGTDCDVINACLMGSLFRVPPPTKHEKTKIKHKQTNHKKNNAKNYNNDSDNNNDDNNNDDDDDYDDDYDDDDDACTVAVYGHKRVSFWCNSIHRLSRCTIPYTCVLSVLSQPRRYVKNVFMIVKLNSCRNLETICM